MCYADSWDDAAENEARGLVLDLFLFFLKTKYEARWSAA